MIEMKRKDLEELHQLLVLYERTYWGSLVSGLLMEVAGRYGRNYGEDIWEKRNPRKAGRKKQYTEKDRGKIRGLRGKGRSIREIARETGCSVGYVQSVLSGSQNGWCS